MQSTKPFTRFAFKSTAVVLMLIMPLVPVHATFLDDFYNSAGASTTLNEAGVYQGQSSTVISGGGLNLRVPNRTMNLFAFSPPSINAGCGGIDLYLGAFGFPTGAEMTAFLRNVGQAAGGIAFSIALKALSPELDSTISNFQKQITDMMNKFKDSCAAAKSLLDATGAGQWVETTVKSFKDQYLTTNNDSTGAERKMSDPAAVNKGAEDQAKLNPWAGVNIERNVVWDALNKSNYGSTMSDVEKKFIMAMVGTVVIKRENNDAGSYPVPKHIKHSLADKVSVDRVLSEMATSTNGANVMAPIIDCSNDSMVESREGFNIFSPGSNCMNITNISGEASLGPSFKYRLTEAANLVRSSILNRSSMTPEVLQAYKTLAGASSLPLHKLVVASAQRRNNYLSQSFLDQSIDYAAKEMAATYLRAALSEAEAALASVRFDQTKTAVVEVTKDIQARAKDLRESLNTREVALRDTLHAMNDVQQMYNQVQQYISQTTTAELTKSVNFLR